MFRNAVRVLGVAGLATAPVLGAAAGAVADEVGPGTAGVRLEYYVPGQRLLAPGESLWFGIEGMPPGWDRVEITSPALQKPALLVPAKKGARESTEPADDGGPRIREGLRAGSYPVTATSHGRTVATTRVKVIGEDAAEVFRFVIGPAGALPGGTTPARVRPGSDIQVLLNDLRGDPEETSLTVTSPVFTGPVTIRTGSPDDPGCKCDDPGTVYAGRGRVRPDVAPGRYPMTVKSHHGKQTTTRHVTVAGEPVAHGPSPAAIGAVSAGAAVLVAGGVIAVRRRRSRTSG
ncbi:hypothetical protein [Streptomyces sp. AM6-12]|uniref:hypothetical protein n=1 Tax=Streptomyces sp. AM6-12 TaxID=3345149 RepID=UPI0037B4F2E7